MPTVACGLELLSSYFTEQETEAFAQLIKGEPGWKSRTIQLETILCTITFHIVFTWKKKTLSCQDFSDTIAIQHVWLVCRSLEHIHQERDLRQKWGPLDTTDTAPQVRAREGDKLSARPACHAAATHLGL